MTRLLILVPVAVMVVVACWGDSRPLPAAVETGAAPEREDEPPVEAGVNAQVTDGGGTVAPAADATRRSPR